MSTLIWMSDHGMGGFAGLLIAAWVFYMVFDAWTTAKARRDGLPIPDPIGLNAILEGREGTFRERVEQAGERLGTHVEYAAQNIGQHWQKAGGATRRGRRRSPRRAMRRQAGHRLEGLRLAGHRARQQAQISHRRRGQASRRDVRPMWVGRERIIRDRRAHTTCLQNTTSTARWGRWC